MKIEARIEQHSALPGPDPWDEGQCASLPLDHIICRDVDGTPYTVGAFVWPWTAYTAHQKKLLLHFFYWKPKAERVTATRADITVEREARMRELQLLMTRQIYYGDENAPRTLEGKLAVLRYIARFAEERSCTVRDVLTQQGLLGAFGATLPVKAWGSVLGWLRFLFQLDPVTQLGFTVTIPERRDNAKQYATDSSNEHQYAPLPTRIYATLINNLSVELDDIETHKPHLLAALRDAIKEHQQASANDLLHNSSIAPALIEKHGLSSYLEERGYSGRRLRDISGAVGMVFEVCKLQIHVFSGMRHSEALHLPYHCMVSGKGLHGRQHCLIAGTTTKFNQGRRLRTKWITTERDGFRAIRVAQDFADVIYESIGIMPSNADGEMDCYPLFPSTDYFPWMKRKVSQNERIMAARLDLAHVRGNRLLSRLCPVIDEADIDELEEIDASRAWSDEPEFAVGQRWPLSTHQLRRSLAIYANASGLVRLSSLRRQLQHITREMSLYYGRGSTFCKNFIADDSAGYKKHVAIDWQDGADEAEMVAFVRDVLNSTEPMFGGAGVYYERQRERGEVMSREEVTKQMKAGLLAYHDGPLGGCTRSGVCETRKGLNLIDTACATDGCRYLIGKHSKIVQVIRLKRAAMTNITIGSITEAMEREELEALERVESKWRHQEALAATIGGKDV